MSEHGDGHVSEQERHRRVLAAWAEKDFVAIGEAFEDLERQVNQLDEHVTERIDAFVHQANSVSELLNKQTECINRVVEHLNKHTEVIKQILTEVLTTQSRPSPQPARKAKVVKLHSARPKRKPTKRDNSDDKPPPGAA